MPAQSPNSHDASTVVARFATEFDTPTKASLRASRAVKARAASDRRRLVDPATCEREYSESELEFLFAMQEYKRKSGRMFPTWGEVLEVVQGLGYQKPA
jgi:hypothetical protein